jgi:hypothetical protein
VNVNVPEPVEVVEALDEPLRARVAALPPAFVMLPEIENEPEPPEPPEDDVP